ncbi:hypothetical protein IQ268_08435 [Oculatella sp. LEGE 06141]|uniref:hypothetical protein n=1 Tax=Oculatella sp. LEGE 06141 TaxID=1828648 RepID=UPI0018805200|nr:hypothetical protein [Oculatella sp. LEGE 06141]MBE9178584.1 hypothetical protein [Oculatella sp. LEGE 06141]
MTRYLTLIDGVRQWMSTAVSSMGAADANKIPSLGSNGKLSETLLDDRLANIINGFAAATVGQVLAKGAGNNLVYATPSGGSGGSGGVLLQHKVVEVTNLMTFSSSATAQIPWDDTIPQITEGSAIPGLSIQVTPLSESSKLRVHAVVYWGSGSTESSDNSQHQFAMFRDNNANAIASAGGEQGTLYRLAPALLGASVPSNSLTATTFHVRTGVPVGFAPYIVINGYWGGNDRRRHGGVIKTFIEVMELA